MKTPRYLIYALCDPRYPEGDPNHVFYIGKSQIGETRPWMHASPSYLRLDDKRNPVKAARIRDLMALFTPKGYTIKVLEELPAPPKGASRQERFPFAFALGLKERQYIEMARSVGWKILNLTDGGENVVGFNLGKKFSDEHKRRMSESQSGENNYWFGKTGSQHPRFGKKTKHTDETKKRIGDSSRGRKDPPETVANKIAAQRRRPSVRPETSGDRNGARRHPERMSRGERQHLAKLNETKVREIRALLGTNQRDLAKMFGVSQGTIHQILSGKTWRHVQ